MICSGDWEPVGIDGLYGVMMEPIMRAGITNAALNARTNITTPIMSSLFAIGLSSFFTAK